MCHTYGALGNWELLAGYGFTLAANPFDTATLPWSALVGAAEEELGARAARRRLWELRGAVRVRVKG